MLSESLFIEYLNALKALVYDKINSSLVFVKFLLNVLQLSGYELNFNTCGTCNMPIMSDIILSATSNEFCCKSCSNNYGLKVDKREYNALKIISNTKYENLKTVKFSEELLVVCINVLKYDIQNVFNHKFITF